MSATQMATSRATDRRLYTYASAILALIMFVGFSKTYYLMTAFDSPPLSGLLHIHGFVMTLWFAVFIAQAQLVARRRTDLHRRLGWISTGLAVLVVILGFLAAISGARHGHTSGGLPPLVFMMIPMSIMFIFALLTAIAISYRRRSDIHKRLMLLASVNMISPAISRIPLPLFQTGGPGLFIGVTIAIVFACVVYDTVRNRRLHPAFGWGAGLLILSFPIRIFLANTAPWLRFASWVVR